MIATRKSKPKSIVGLDIEASSVAATELRANGRTAIGAYGVAPLASGVFRDGEVHEPDELARTIKELFAAHKLPKDVRLGVANQRVAVRTLRLPRIDDPAELETAIRFQAQDHIPVPLDQAVLDWEVIPSQAVPGEQLDGIEVVTVAARRDMILRAMEAVEGAGLRLVGIDLSAFALIRALSGEGAAVGEISDPGAAFDPIGDNGGENGATATGEVPDASLPAQASTRLYCHLGDLTNIAVARGPYCLFTRVSSFGIEGIAQSLAERSGLTLEHARQWLTHVGLEAPPESIEGDPQTVAATRDALAAGAARLGEELRRSLEYFDSFDGSVPLEGVLVAGPGAAIPGLVSGLRHDLSLPLDSATPAALVGVAGGDAARLTLSYGLGLEE